MEINIRINTDKMKHPDEPECEISGILQHITYLISGEGMDIKTACDITENVFEGFSVHPTTVV